MACRVRVHLKRGAVAVILTMHAVRDQDCFFFLSQTLDNCGKLPGFSVYWDEITISGLSSCDGKYNRYDGD